MLDLELLVEFWTKSCLCVFRVWRWENDPSMVWFTTLFDRFLQSRRVHKHGWWNPLCSPITIMPLFSPQYTKNHEYQIPFPILLLNIPSSDSAIEGLETSARLNDVALVRGCAMEALGITTSPVCAWIYHLGKMRILCGRAHKARVWLTKIDDADRFKAGKFFAVRVWR